MLKQLPDTPNIPSQINLKAACLAQSGTSSFHSRRIPPSRQVEYAIVGRRSEEESDAADAVCSDRYRTYCNVYRSRGQLVTVYACGGHFHMNSWLHGVGGRVIHCSYPNPLPVVSLRITCHIFGWLNLLKSHVYGQRKVGQIYNSYQLLAKYALLFESKRKDGRRVRYVYVTYYLSSEDIYSRVPKQTSSSDLAALPVIFLISYFHRIIMKIIVKASARQSFFFFFFKFRFIVHILHTWDCNKYGFGQSNSKVCRYRWSDSITQVM